jgi:hypothetical protein
MSHEAARKLLETVIRHSGEQDTVLGDIQGMCTEDEFRDYRRAIGQSMVAMLDVIHCIIAKYPDLKPPQLK